MTRAAPAPAATFQWYVGVDWGTAEHAVSVTDVAGRVVGERRVSHTSVGLAEFVDWLLALTGARLEQVAVAIEKPHGAVVELLLERGAAVFAINPKQLDRFRDRFSVAGAKDDALDAHVLCSAVRTDQALFRRLVLDEPLVIRVRELTRASDVLQQEALALTNRLRELVHRVRPEWLSLSPNADDPWFWAFLALVATPALGRPMRRKKMETLLTTYRIRRVTVDDVLTVLEAPVLPVAPGTVEAVTKHMQLLLRRVQLVQEQRQGCMRELEQVLRELSAGPPEPPSAGVPTTASASDPRSTPAAPSDVAIVRSLPGVGTIVLATLIADASPLLRERDYGALRGVTGVAPVRRQSGKNKRGVVSMRYACSRRLRNATYHFARVSIQLDATARTYYATLRARGHSHGRALRSVADRWLRILMAMLRSRTLYDRARFATT